MKMSDTNDFSEKMNVSRMNELEAKLEALTVNQKIEKESIRLVEGRIKSLEHDDRFKRLETQAQDSRLTE